MAGWLARWEKRRQELAEGVDADLMQANRRKFRVAYSLFGAALAVFLLREKIDLPSILEKGLAVGGAASGCAGLVLMRWAQAERNFLTKPDPEGPPEIFRSKPE